MIKVLLKFNAAVIKEFPMTGQEIKVGRKPDNDIVIDNPAVSGHHCRIVRQGDDVLLEDLNSTNGTFLHERRVLKANLHHKDEVGVAKHTLVLWNDEEAAAPPPPPAAPMNSDATIVMSRPAAPPPDQAKKAETVGGLRVVGGGEAGVYALTGLTTYIGKSDQAAIRLKGLFAPDLAACIARKPEGYVLKAVKEKAVKLNSQVLADQAVLAEGDLVETGGLKLVFFLQSADGPLAG